jgi:hypothetical protein
MMRSTILSFLQDFLPELVLPAHEGVDNNVLLASHVSHASGFWISKKLTDKSTEKLKQTGPKSAAQFVRTGVTVDYGANNAID